MMTPEQFRLVQSIFLRLRTLPRDEALAQTASACGGDSEVEAAVRIMLLHDDDDINGTIETPMPREISVEQFLSAAQPGQRLGNYRIVRLIGHGGQAEVYEAEQLSPSRRVAIKIIKPGMDSRSVLARFEAERQALALMDHANIARIFDSGATPQGRPFFVMELVHGIPITEHCDRHRMTIEDRLALFAEVCDAVAHAHTKGVIHRDLKPTNILVSVHDSTKPVPKIIDFGVAKATSMRLTEQTMFTEHGVLIGTPEYMSPEQAEMSSQDIDTRTDVYSLGVILYELLAGTVPFESKALRDRGFDEIRRIIREDAPPKPSTKVSLNPPKDTEIAYARQTQPEDLVRQLHCELEWIPLKALRKSRQERYRTAQEFGDDLRNYLTSRPLIAAPESIWYRAKKFSRRNRGAVVALMAIFFSLLVGLTTTLLALDRAQRAEKVSAKESTTAKATLAQNQMLQASITSLLIDFYDANTNKIKEIIDKNPNPTDDRIAEVQRIQQSMQLMLKQIENKGLMSPELKDRWETVSLRFKILGWAI